ncbi:hypothetical protein SEA_DAUBENSKI_86 [Streptomyces phage Daubenski]|uniref:Uncharacterized protein n=1 Tax=Streptomyces phage Daubenski TaxID=2653725 RepID=A0A5Q2WHN5_9CAUD|nr:hypothetical protein KNU80_gp180 [Streptomyces phage Daubenski]QGH76394.1 hypothetical protein SEA_DAUBENSKI_86 [Streptomyces phage Daubenski]
MINPFLQPPQKPVDDVPQGILIDGTFVCMTCNESCDEAEYFPVEKILVWLCTNEHRSAIEGFSLGV